MRVLPGSGLVSPGVQPYVRNVNGAVVLFDGVCNLCNGAVQFVLDHERSRPGAESVRFAALQSEAAQGVLAQVVGPEQARALREGQHGAPDSIVVVEGGKVHTSSDAALRLARHLRAPWRWLGVLWVVPRPLRDLVYRWIARNRYRWFGKDDTCRVPTPELRARFL